MIFSQALSIDRQLTADAKYADIVLPSTTMFEIDSYMSYGPIFRHREKMIEPVGEARSDYLIMANLANRLGYGHLYPQTEEAVLNHVLEGSGFTLEQVREAGGWVKMPTPMMEYKKWEKGSCRPDGKLGFDTPTGKLLLQRVAQLLGQDGALLIGVDMKKELQRLNVAYNDAQGVTAAFNLNLLTRINRELEADFELSRFDHHAFYNEKPGRVEMHLVSNTQQEVNVDKQTFAFTKGETIHTENSYKYTVEQFHNLATKANFQAEQVWIDSDQLFSVHCLRVR